MPLYTATLPDGWTQDDAVFAATQAGLTPDGSNLSGATITLICLADQNPGLVAAWQAACTGPPPATSRRTRETIESRIDAAMATMRTIIDKAQYNVANVAQAQAAIRDIQADMRAQARSIRLLIRAVRDDTGGTD